MERTPITLLEKKQSNYEQKNAAYTDLTSKLNSLESAADALRSASNWGDRTTTISDTDEFMVISTWRSLKDWDAWNSNVARREIQQKIDAMLKQKTVAKAYYYG